MQRRLLLCGLGALLLGVVGCGSATTASAKGSGGGILFLRTPADNGRVQQLQLWRSGGSVRSLGPSGDYVLTPQWSPDGKSIAVADEPGGWDDPAAYDIYVMSADGSHFRRLTYDSNRTSVFRADEPSWSPDGRQIAFVRDIENSPYEELVVVDVRTGRERRLPVTPTAYGSLAWGRAGIVYADGDGRLMLVNPAGGRPRLFARAPSNRFTWSRAGALAALEKGKVVLFSAAGKELRALSEPFEAKTHVCGIAWSPDGRQILVRTAQRQLGLWTVALAGGTWRRLPVPIQTSTIDDCGVSWR